MRVVDDEHFRSENQWTFIVQSRIVQFGWTQKRLEEWQNEFLVLWMAPFLSYSGYGTEAIDFVMGLEQERPDRTMCVQYGDAIIENKVLADQEKKIITQCRDKSWSVIAEPLVGICHTPPSTWGAVEHGWYCPSYATVVNIGRTMFESDSIPHSWLERLRFMDQVWVPTKFNLETFTRAGVARDKIHVIPPPLNPFFDPDKVPLTFSFPASFDDQEFIFLSIFKWEDRKGWKYLIKAFHEEFSEDPTTKLYILTQRRGDETPTEKVLEYLGGDPASLQNIHISTSQLPPLNLLALYSSVDAFVLPSHGEGWGLPIVEAMSMELPVITTNWSGPTEYLTEENSFPLAIEPDLIPISFGSMGVEPSDIRGHKWADPSIKHLKTLMRYVVDHPDEAEKRGKQARQDLIKQFNPSLISKLVTKQLQEAVDKYVTKIKNQNQTQPQPQEQPPKRGSEQKTYYNVAEERKSARPARKKVGKHKVKPKAKLPKDGYSGSGGSWKEDSYYDQESWY